jgi:protein-S-isoprenylcysteine O-methyltransferase Ste14
MSDSSGYGLWSLVVINSVVFILFALLIGVGFILIANAWRVLYDAQRTHTLATTGPYAHVRHPQYVGFILIMLGFLVQWPTILTLAMFPVLTVMYVKLAKTEEKDAVAEFGDEYRRYMYDVPGFIPRLSRLFGPESTGAYRNDHRRT